MTDDEPQAASEASIPDTGRAKGTRTWVFVLILAAFLVLTTCYNISNPLFESPDELQHAAYAVWLADERSLPVLDPEQPGPVAQEGAQAPLYYWLVAASLGKVPHRTADNLAVLNPHANIGDPLRPGNKNRVLHDMEQEGWPYEGTTLFVRLARALSSILAVGSLGAIYRLGRMAFPSRPGVALGMIALVAFTPQFLYLSSTVSNDNLVILIASWVLVLLAAWLRLPRLPGWGQVGLMGPLLGLAVLAKLSGVLLWPLVAGVLLWLAWRERDGRWLVKAGLVCFAVALAVCGWWFVRNQLLYGDITASQTLAAALGGQRQVLPSRLSDISAEFRGFRYSLWALFGWFNILAPDAYYWVVDAMTAVGALGFSLFVVRSLPRYPQSTREIILMLCVWLCLVAAGVLRWAVLISSQGRLAFPALAAAALFLVIGWAEVIPRHLHRAMGIVGVASWAAWAAICPALIIQPAYAPPSALDPGEVSANVSRTTDVTFQDGVMLLGYHLERETVEPDEQVWMRACWQGTRDLEANYSVFVQVLVENDLIAAQSDTYHGLGSFPTSFWPVGIVFCDQYPLRIADTVPAPGSTVISMGLYNSSGERLSAFNAGAQITSDHVRFPGPAIVFQQSGRRLKYNWDQQIALVDYELGTTAVSPGGDLAISLTWSAARSVSSDYAATLQVLDEQGQKIGQSDVLLPISTWQVGSHVIDHHTITISPGATAGVYHLKLAVYEPESVQNLTLYRDQDLVPSGGLLNLWTLRVRLE
ncbi:MAG: glycosyltransferase family 39 protein [Anaerolineae bacterium]